MPEITVLTVTDRPGGLDILKHDLRRQTVQDFELVLVDGRHEQRREAAIDYLSEFDLTYVEPRPPREHDVWNLNKAYNDGLAESEGDLVVSLQDYIWIPPDGLESFRAVHEETGGFVTGVGHKYGQPATAATLHGATTIFEEPYAGQPTDVVERDARIEGANDGDDEDVVETAFQEWELDWAAFPLDAAYALGGFDEWMDRVYSGDNVQFAYRASKLGYRFYLDRRNECRGFAHSQWFDYPDDWEANHFNNRPRLHRYDDDVILEYL